MKKIFAFITVTMLSFAFSAVVFAGYKLDKTCANKGYVIITYDGALSPVVKVEISRAGTDSKDYFTLISNKPTNLPIQLGDGKYTLKLLQLVEGNMYLSLGKEEFDVKLVDNNERYLISNAYIDYNTDMNFLKGYNTTLEKINAINEKLAKFYDDVVRNYTYDNDKAANLRSGYVPVIDNTYKVKKGICSDYSTLVAGYLRSLGIPTKVVMGYNPEIYDANKKLIYHAWNEIYIDGKWYVVDATYDSAYVHAGMDYTMKKNWDKLTVAKVF